MQEGIGAHYHRSVPAIVNTEIGMMVSMFILFSLLFDIFKKFGMYLVYKDQNMSTEAYLNKMKILPYVLFCTQFTIGIFQIDMIIGVLMTAILYEYQGIYFWEKL